MFLYYAHKPNAIGHDTMNDTDHINWPKTEALRIARECAAAGFRAYIAEQGNYGFFTDGAHVVSFQVGHFATRYAGNYRTSEPKKTGTGWELAHGNGYADMLAQGAPKWAVGNAQWRHTTEAEHLANYGPSSKHQEVTA